MSVAAQLPDQCMAVNDKIDQLTRGCTEFGESVNLRKLLHLVLRLGNVINESSKQRQGACGFELSTGLPMIMKHKATSDSKYTFMHYLSEFVEIQAPELLQVIDELEQVKTCKCLAIEVVALRLQANNISKNVELVKSEVDKVTKRQEEGMSKEGDESFLTFTKLFLDEVGVPSADRTAAKFGTLEKQTTELLITFGENVKTGSVQELFECVLDFCTSLKQTHADTEMARLAEEIRENPPMSPRGRVRRTSSDGASVSSTSSGLRRGVLLTETSAGGVGKQAKTVEEEVDGDRVNVEQKNE
jgi:hypothetical protein